MRSLTSFRPDGFVIALLATVALASLLPAHGAAATLVAGVSKAAVALLFFLHGARLPRQAVIAGASQWRLHLLVLATTFLLFPALGLVLARLPPALLAPQLATGMLFLCALPSTVQSSIAFTSIARGNVAAAICAASASNLLGVLLTPLLVGMLMGSHGGGLSLHALEAIVLQLLLPFALGQLMRPWLGGWASRHGRLLGLVDRGSILLIVYVAFGAAVTSGLWARVPPVALLQLVLACVALLAVVMVLTTLLSRTLGFSRADEIAIVFCGSKKSLASGVALASILFTSQTAGMIVLPLMLFHQVQLMVCAARARSYATAEAGMTTSRSASA